MKLYYTSSSSPNVEQTKPFLSLGGYKSLSSVQNSRFENFFSDISSISISNFNQNQYLGLVLKNETGNSVTGIQLWFEYPDGCFCLYRVAAVDMAIDSDGVLQMEKVYSINDKPLNAEFHEADGSDNKVDLGDLEIDGQIGIWIERELLLDIIKAQQSNIYEPDPNLEGRFRAIVLPVSDEIKIAISYS